MTALVSAILSLLGCSHGGNDAASQRAKTDSTKPPEIPFEEVVNNEAFQIGVRPGWMRTEDVPRGMNVGLRKKVAQGDEATLFFHYEVMPPDAGEPPSDTSDMVRQWDSVVRNQYPDADSVGSTALKPAGRIFINSTYDLTDTGKKVRRRYTYFLSGRTAFIVQCTAVPEQWSGVLADFDAMVASLQPGGVSAKPQTQTKSDDAAKADLERVLPALFGSFPREWRASLSDVTIAPASPKDKRTVVIALMFDRPDIGDIYLATRTLFAAIQSGKSDSDLNAFPSATRSAASKSGDFIKFVGQVWGLASGYVANCKPPVERYTLPILDSHGQRVGSVSISRDDGAAILAGKVTASDARRVAAMYVFE